MKKSLIILALAFSLIEAKLYGMDFSSVIHVIGDSHSMEFRNLEHCLIHTIGPITMHRVGRDGLDILDFRSFDIQEGDIVILTFGEIDVRCHIGKQRDLENRDLDEILDSLLENYFSTILLNKSLYKNVTVIAYTVTPPTDQTYNPEYPFYGAIEDRVFIARKLNNKLHDLASKLGIDVIDVFDDYADSRGVLIPALSDYNVHLGIQDPIRQKLDKAICKEMEKRDRSANN